MRVLDTNVVSELMKLHPSPAVLTWFKNEPVTSLFTTTITQAEMLYGVALLPYGRRRDLLAEQAEAVFREDFAGRILAFDQEAARCFAQIAADADQAGRTIPILDAQIAAIARSRGAALVTRNVDHFERCGIDIVNPWNA